MTYQEEPSDLPESRLNQIADNSIRTDIPPLGGNQSGIDRSNSLEQSDLSDELSAAIQKIQDKEVCLEYAERRILELQQKIDMIQNTRSWKITYPLRAFAQFIRRQRSPLEADQVLMYTPMKSLEQTSAGVFRVTGEDPQLLIQNKLHKGIYLFRWEGYASKRVMLKLYPDYGQGYVEKTSLSLGYLTTKFLPHERFLTFSNDVVNLRLDPGEEDSNILFMENIRYIRLSPLSLFRVRISLIAQKTQMRKTRLFFHLLNLRLTGRKHEVTNLFDSSLKYFGEGRFTGSNEDAYQQYILECEPNSTELSEQPEKAKILSIQPLISIIVPVYNTNKQMLIDMIESVRSQTYEKWELCLADGHSQKPYVAEILKKYEAKDKRIKVVLLKENFGIVGNSNAALNLAHGKYIALLDHDDILPKWALYTIAQAINDHQEPDILYSDEDKITFDGKERFYPHFKPEWSPDLLRSYNYITHFFVAKRSLVIRAGNFLPGYDGSQDYDLILRTTELADKIVHIPQILYHWRSHSESTAQSQGNKSYTFDAGVKALSDYLRRNGLEGEVTYNLQFGFYHINYKLTATPLVSIIIPNYEHLDDLRRCMESIFSLTSYQNYEIVIVENNSKTDEIFAYYRELQEKHGVRIVTWEREFNYSAINNYAVRAAKGDVLLFLNNDTKIISPDWIEQLLQYAQRDDVGAVGAKLYYEDDTIQHGGVILGFLGIAGHSFSRLSKEDPGYMGRAMVAQNVSAVTAACLMMKKKLFEELGGFDESLEVAFNDIDLCLKIRQAGKLIVYNPYAELYHLESISRGFEDTKEKQARFFSEIDYFNSKWKKELLAGDPYYNPHLDLEQTPFRISGT